MSKKYCVIGAGAAGLPALKMLLDEGYEVDCFEKTDKVGGHWNTDYDFLHLITSRQVTGYEHWPMPDDFPLFPPKHKMLEYFNMYATEFGLFDKITFNTEVTSCVPFPGDGLPGSNGWEVKTSDGKTQTYEGVFIANGHLWDEKIPEFEGEFTGIQIHSGSYKNTKQVEGRVLVVGSGNSGCDLAVDCAQNYFDTSIVMRRGHFFQPKTFFGQPRAELKWMGEFNFEEQDLIARLMMKVAVGEWNNYPGMPEPDHKRLMDGPPVVNNLLLYWLQHGRITVKPGIKKFDGKNVHFEDGTVEHFDTILWATGFHTSLPMLDNDLIQWSADKTPLRVGAGVIPIGLEKCYLIGLIAARGGQPMQYPIQMELALRMLKLHEREGGTAQVSQTLTDKQEPEWRIDILRPIWFDQISDTKEILAKMG